MSPTMASKVQRQDQITAQFPHILNRQNEMKKNFLEFGLERRLGDICRLTTTNAQTSHLQM